MFEYELAPSQPTYSYFLTDLRTNNIVGELDFQNVSYSNILSGIGDFSGTLPINRDTLSFITPPDVDPDANPYIDQTRPTYDVRSVTVPGRYGLYVYREGEPVWGGILWKRQRSSGETGGSLVCTAKTFESYFYHRFQRTTKYWADEDQLEIARWLVESNGSAAALDIAIDQTTSTRRRERTMFGYEYKTTGEELEQLANLIDGFDWNIEIGLDENESPTRTLRFYYPQAGVPRNKTTLQFNYPGVIKSYTMTDDSETGGNYIWAIGAGEGTEMIVESAADYPQLAQGWPKLETMRSYKSVLRPSTLLEHANQALNQMNTPTTVFEVDIRGDLSPLYGTYSLGDWAKFRFQDYYFFESGVDQDPYSADLGLLGPDSEKIPVYERMARITGINVSVDTTSGIENISLELGGDELAGEE